MYSSSTGVKVRRTRTAIIVSVYLMPVIWVHCITDFTLVHPRRQRVIQNTSRLVHPCSQWIIHISSRLVHSHSQWAISTIRLVTTSSVSSFSLLVHWVRGVHNKLAWHGSQLQTYWRDAWSLTWLGQSSIETGLKPNCDWTATLNDGSLEILSRKSLILELKTFHTWPLCTNNYCRQQEKRQLTEVRPFYL